MRLWHRGPHRFLADPDRHEGLGPSRPVLLEEDKPLRLVCASEGTVRFRVAEGSMGGTPVLIQAHGLLRKGVKTTVGADNTFQAHLVDGAEYTVWIMASDKSGPLEADRRFYARHRIHASTRREHVIPLRPLRALSGRLRHEGIESVFPITAKLGPWTWSARANQRGEFSFPALPRERITLKHTVLLNSVSGEVVTSLEGEVRGVGFLNYEVVAQPDATYVDLPEESGER